MNRPYVILYMNLGPYHIARLRALASSLPQLHVIEVASEQKLYPWRPNRDQLGFACTTLFENDACETIPVRRQCSAVKMALSRLNPAAVIVAGYGELCMRAALRWARQRGIPAVLLFVSTQNDRPRIWWKELVKSRLLRCYATVAVAGQSAEQYALRLGVDKAVIVRVGNVVDNSHYVRNGQINHDGVAQERCGQVLPERHFLAVSRLSSEKNLPRLLEAYGRYRREGGQWDLVLIGSGPLESELKQMVRTNAIPGTRFVGWVCYEELPSYYARASCFILPSTSDTWGLVVNEAMASGLPVLVSQNCGCVPELCRSNENGFSFDPESTDEMTRCLHDIARDDVRRNAFAQASKRIVSSFTPESWANNLKKCIGIAEKRKA